MNAQNDGKSKDNAPENPPVQNDGKSKDNAPENPPVHVTETEPIVDQVPDDDEHDPRGGFIVFTDKNGKQKRVKRSRYNGEGG